MSVVYPVPGRSLNCAPQEALETDAATAARLVRTGAFSKSAPTGSKADPIPYEADERLDFYDHPRDKDHDTVVHKKAPTEGELGAPAESTETKVEE